MRTRFDFCDAVWTTTVVSYKEVPKAISAVACCGRVAKVSVCRTVRQWFESGSRLSIQLFI